MKAPIALTIAGSDSGGGAGIQADLKTFAALGVHGLTAITSVTAQNTQKVENISDLSGKFVGIQIDTLLDDFEVKWAKTGMVSNGEIIKAISEKSVKHGINLVVDPVMIAASGSSLLKEDSLEELKEFLREAKLVTPNIPEAEKLSGTDIETKSQAKDAAKEIADLGPENVLIKGGHLDTEKIHNILFHGGEFFDLETNRVPVPEVHGTGCSFSAAITAELAKGESLKSSVKNAGEFMVDAIRGRLNIGRGVEVVDPLARIWKVTGDGEEIEEVQKAAKNLANTPNFVKLIPEVGTNIVMAPEGADKPGDAVGLTGRIVKAGGKPFLSGIPAHGGSEHVANFVLTAKKHNPQIRAGMNLRFSDENLKKCRELGLKISSFDRKEEPSEVKTMEWGTEKAIEKFGGVPDVIYDRGGIGKEPMIRILGKKATEVSEIALQIAKKIT